MRQRILIIDNDALIRQVLAICLNDAGWDVSQYNHAHIDSAALKDLHPALIILDFTRERVVALDGSFSRCSKWMTQRLTSPS